MDAVRSANHAVLVTVWSCASQQRAITQTPHIPAQHLWAAGALGSLGWSWGASRPTHLYVKYKLVHSARQGLWQATGCDPSSREAALGLVLGEGKA